MEEVKLKQSTASNPKISIWTSASAGSGKTTVLVKRLLRMFLNGIQPNKILCITFTNTGAIQMKNRINEKLAQWSVLKDEDLKKEILELENTSENIEKKIKVAKTLFAKILDHSNDFKILTIHSFCQQIIKRFPLEANIIPNFKIADEIISRELLLKAKNELLKIENEELKKSIEYIFTYKNEKEFLELLEKAINNKDTFLYLQNRFYSFENLTEEIKLFFDLEQNDTEKNIEEKFFKDLNLDIFNKNNIDYIKENGLKTDLEKIKIFEENFVLEEYFSLFLTKENKPRSRIFTKNILKNLPDLNFFIEEEQKRVYNFVQKKMNFVNFEFTTNFLKILFCILNIYSALKKDEGYLDYNDLIFETDKLLNDQNYKSINTTSYSSWINYKLDEGIDHILVDEAQDTSPIQWSIIRSITEEFFSGYGSKENFDRTIFIVGDEKQSIFSFQGADPKIFELTLKDYQKKIQECEKAFEIINLNTSFRSLKSILNIVDEVFKNPDKKQSISKTSDKIIHNVFRNDTAGKVEVWPLIKSKEKEEKKEENLKENKDEGISDWKINYTEDIELTNKQKLAEVIANEISFWFKNNKIIFSRKDKKFRKIKYSDIMILVKDRDKDFINYLIRQFNKHNIPTMGNDRFKLMDNIITQDIISLCKFLIFNNDDLSLANIVKSPILNLTEEDLYILCDYKNIKNTTLWNAFKNLNINNTKDFLEDLLQKSKLLNVYEFLFYLFETKNIRKNFKERFLYLADDIINELLTLSNNYEKQHINSTLLSFIDFLENNDFQIKRDLEQLTDEVKIITVHSSKGLESPIIILPDTVHDLKKIQKIDKILYCKEEGNDFEIPILVKEKSDFVEEKKEEIKNEVQQEYYRLLYVAMTRAENELYVCGYEKSCNENCWYSLIKNAMKNLEYKTKKVEFSDEDIIYVGDDDFFEKTEKTENIKKEEKNLNEISNILSKETKVENEIKIINPSLYYSENIIKKPYENSENLENGKIVHKLLEILPNTKQSDWENIINIYLKNNNYKEKIKKIVLDVLYNKDFNFLFAENSQAEVPIFGKIENNIFSGQIDRLTITEKKIYIVDYKNTNFLPTSTPTKYIKQLEIYKKLIEKIYKSKIVECYILWTSFGKIEKIF